jgi:putative transposase
VVDVYVESRRKSAAARQFFKRLLRNHDDQPRTIVTDKLASYRVAQRELMPKVHHNTAKHVNNRAEQLHESTRFRERGMGGLSSRVRYNYS